MALFTYPLFIGQTLEWLVVTRARKVAKSEWNLTCLWCDFVLVFVLVSCQNEDQATGKIIFLEGTVFGKAKQQRRDRSKWEKSFIVVYFLKYASVRRRHRSACSIRENRCHKNRRLNDDKKAKLSGIMLICNIAKIFERLTHLNFWCILFDRSIKNIIFYFVFHSCCARSAMAHLKRNHQLLKRSKI